MLEIVYCDDEASFQDAFKQNHASDDTRITMHSDVEGLPAFLDSLEHSPDLLVLDLFHTAAPPGSPEAAKVNAEVDRQLVQVDAAIAALKSVVDAGKRPAALGALAAIRDNPKFEDLPVLLYTRQGLSLLDDEQLNQAVNLHAEWLLKGHGPHFEANRIRNFVSAQRARQVRRNRELFLALGGALVGFLLERLYHVISHLFVA